MATTDVNRSYLRREYGDSCHLEYRRNIEDQLKFMKERGELDCDSLDRLPIMPGTQHGNRRRGGGGS